MKDWMPGNLEPDVMNPDLQKLKPYPFVRLAELKKDLRPPDELEHIAMSIGEPRHAPPGFVVKKLRSVCGDLANYPMAPGLAELREAIAGWLVRRYALNAAAIDPETMILPVTGTREGLFAFAQAVVDRTKNPLVLMPNPFYQIYEGAALLAGAEPYYLNTDSASGFLPDLDAVPNAVWQRCQLLYICTPGNPTGAVMDRPFLERVLDLADYYEFIIAADECYAEIYLDENQPPPGLLEVCAATGRHRFQRCVVFHSLSKRSNLPGLRSGFVAGCPEVMRQFLDYRTYHGCAMPIPAQLASIAAWGDDEHVRENRARYREKFDRVIEILDPVLPVERPPATFYLWPETSIDDEEFVKRLYADQNVTALPGSYLARDTSGGNPGHRRVRFSLVATVDACADAALRISEFVATL